MPEPHRSRTSGQRSRSGCITCKIRRVKCDETRPSCTRCLTTGRTCDGYAPSTTARRALASAVLLLGPASRVLGAPVSASDAACFDFFRHCTATMTGSVLPSAFWERLVLQMAYAERAVWRVVVALGALHRRWECSGNREAVGRFTAQAARHYYGAMALAREITAPQTLAVLSAALAAAAHLAGLWAESQVHIRAGLRLLHEAALPGLPETLDRLDLQAMFFEDARAPYVYAHSTPAPAVVPEVFSSLADAALVIFRLVRSFMLAGAAAEQGALDRDGLEAALGCVGASAARWEDALRVFLAGRRPLDGAERRMVLVMRLWQTTLLQVLRAGVVGPETRWDRCLSLFVRSVELAGEIARTTEGVGGLPFFMSLEPGVATPLFLTAVRCRHPVVRRRALGLLEGMKRQEGIWNCGVAGRVAGECVGVEEEGLGVGLEVRGVGEGEGRGLMGGWDGVGEGEGGEVDGDGVVRRWPGGWPNVPEERRLLQTSLVVDVEGGVVGLTIFVTGEDGMGREVKTVRLEI